MNRDGKGSKLITRRPQTEHEHFPRRGAASFVNLTFTLLPPLTAVLKPFLTGGGKARMAGLK